MNQEKLRKLVEKWRKHEKTASITEIGIALGRYNCADELEQALAEQPGLTEEQVQTVLESVWPWKNKDGVTSIITDKLNALLSAPQAPQGAPLPTTSTAVYLGPYTGPAEPAPAAPIHKGNWPGGNEPFPNEAERELSRRDERPHRNRRAVETLD